MWKFLRDLFSKKSEEHVEDLSAPTDSRSTMYFKDVSSLLVEDAEHTVEENIETFEHIEAEKHLIEEDEIVFI